MIELHDVWLDRNGRTVLSDISLRLTEQRIGLIGANGSGKSSFARLLNGLLLPTKGRVAVNGLDTRDDAKAVRRQVGFIFQNPDNQIICPTVGEDIAFGLRNREIPRKEIAERVRLALAARGLSDFEDRLVHELSGGQKQLVALAGVLVLAPDILVLDEPTTLLDLANTRALMRALSELNAQIVMMTHDLALLENFERVIWIDAGKIRFDGAPEPAIAAYRGSQS